MDNVNAVNTTQTTTYYDSVNNADITILLYSEKLFERMKYEWLAG